MERREEDSDATVVNFDDRKPVPDSATAEAWSGIDRIRERNANLDPDAEPAVISGIVEDVRQERYDRRQQAEIADRR